MSHLKKTFEAIEQMEAKANEVKERIPASITAACKLWYVTSGEYTPDEDPESHWGVFWEPLDVKLPASARPSCCYSDSIVFYDRTGNKLLQDYVRHYNFMGLHPHLLYLAGMWREVISGRVEYRDGHWYMRWTVATNTRFALLANAAMEVEKRKAAENQAQQGKNPMARAELSGILPDDMADAFESFKLAIIRHRGNGWREVPRQQAIDALLFLLDATEVDPTDDDHPF